MIFLLNIKLSRSGMNTMFQRNWEGEKKNLIPLLKLGVSAFHLSGSEYHAAKQRNHIQ